MSGATYLVTTVSVRWYVHRVARLLGCGHLKNFENFIRFQKFQNQNVFQAILSNFDFSDQRHPPPPPQPLTLLKMIYFVSNIFLLFLTSRKCSHQDKAYPTSKLFETKCFAEDCCLVCGHLKISSDLKNVKCVSGDSEQLRFLDPRPSN